MQQKQYDLRKHGTERAGSVYAALVTFALDWVERFTSLDTNALCAQIRTCDEIYGNAVVLFHKKDFDEALAKEKQELPRPFMSITIDDLLLIKISEDGAIDLPAMRDKFKQWEREPVDVEEKPEECAELRAENERLKERIVNQSATLDKLQRKHITLKGDLEYRAKRIANLASLSVERNKYRAQAQDLELKLERKKDELSKEINRNVRYSAILQELMRLVNKYKPGWATSSTALVTQFERIIEEARSGALFKAEEEKKTLDHHTEVMAKDMETLALEAEKEDPSEPYYIKELRKQMKTALREVNKRLEAIERIVYESKEEKKTLHNYTEDNSI